MVNNMDEANIEDVVKLLDKLLTHKGKEVHDSLRELLVIAALTDGTDAIGPLEKLLHRVASLEQEVSILKLTSKLNVDQTNTLYPTEYVPQTWVSSSIYTMKK